jgi:hopanoid C-3 methylase
MGDILIVSTFEGGYQPITAVTAASALSVAGFDVSMLDVYVEGLQRDQFAKADIIAISVPLFDSLHAGIQVATEIRASNPSRPIIFFGQYATLNARRLLGAHGDYAIVGEWEQPLVKLVRHLRTTHSAPMPAEIAGVAALSAVGGKDRRVQPFFSRDHFHVPERRFAPPLAKYPQPNIERITGGQHLVGGLETTRGCHHKCTYCSVFAAYDGKVLLVPPAIVMEDVRNLMAQGMTHLTFTDADFFNAKQHSLRILREIHGAYPDLTYDFTTRVDHLLANPEILREMARMGVRFITSALEFPKQRVLDEISKEVTVDMIENSIAFLREIGIVLNPTFILFNPWIDLSDLARFNDFVERNELEHVIESIQYETRLHLYKGSPLLQNPSIRQLELQEREFHFEWKHPDPRVDEVYFESLTPAEEGTFKRCCLKC